MEFLKKILWQSKDPQAKAQELDELSQMWGYRTSKCRFDTVRVTYENGCFAIRQEGISSLKYAAASTREARKFLKRHYENLRYSEGRDAPNDVFLDSMNKVNK
jgi:hypothetical protein